MQKTDASILSSNEGETYVIGSWNILSRVLPEQTDGHFEMYYFVLPAGEEVAYHVHDRANETIYVIEGEVVFHVDGKKFPGKAGATAFVPMGLHHGFRNESGAEARTLLVFSPCTMQNEFFREMEKVFASPNPDLARIKALQEKYDQKLIAQ
jgi:quercetin dioxygenase-like cupin family protein